MKHYVSVANIFDILNKRIYSKGDNILVKDENTRISVTLPKTMHEELEELAQEQNRSVSNLAFVIIKTYLRKRKKMNRED